VHLSPIGFTYINLYKCLDPWAVLARSPQISNLCGSVRQKCRWISRVIPPPSRLIIYAPGSFRSSSLIGCQILPAERIERVTRWLYMRNDSIGLPTRSHRMAGIRLFYTMLYVHDYSPTIDVGVYIYRYVHHRISRYIPTKYRMMVRWHVAVGREAVEDCFSPHHPKGSNHLPKAYTKYSETWITQTSEDLWPVTPYKIDMASSTQSTCKNSFNKFNPWVNCGNMTETTRMDSHVWWRTVSKTTLVYSCNLWISSDS